MSAPARIVASAPRPWERRHATLRVNGWTLEGALEPEALLETLRTVGHHLTRSLGVAEEALHLHAHRFEPQGVSVVMLLPGLRGVLHTWPEHGLATVDLAGADGDTLEQWLRELAGSLRMEASAAPG